MNNFCTEITKAACHEDANDGRMTQDQLKRGETEEMVAAINIDRKMSVLFCVDRRRDCMS